MDFQASAAYNESIGPGMEITYQVKGNTKIAAEFIQKAVGGELFEIEADRNYSEDHMVLIEKARQRPDALEHFDTIFLGCPNWWGTCPMVLFTFLEQYGWTGKRIIPFCTDKGGGIGDSVRDIQKICKGADVEVGASFTGSRVSGSEVKIAEWAKGRPEKQ